MATRGRLPRWVPLLGVAAALGALLVTLLWLPGGEDRREARIRAREDRGSVRVEFAPGPATEVTAMEAPERERRVHPESAAEPPVLPRHTGRRLDPIAVVEPPETAWDNAPDVRSAAEDDFSAIAAGAAVLEGCIRQPDGRAVPGLEISLRPAGRREVVATAFTDDGGGYTFSQVPAGRYRLDIGPAAEPIAYAPDRLRLDPQRNRYDLRSPLLGAMVVRVKDARGEADLPGVEVVLKERLGRSWRGRTGEDGTAEFPNLPASEYRILLYRGKRRVLEERKFLFANTKPEVVVALPDPPEPEAEPDEAQAETATKRKGKAGSAGNKKAGNKKAGKSAR